jgi:hypothetical protein
MLSRSKKALAFSAVAIVIVIVLLVSAFLGLGGSGQPAGTPTPPASTSTPTPVVVAEKKPFYFGVTYCGNSTTEAKQLVDRVKNYTNLFVIQSGPLMSKLSAMTEICDYAVNSGLDIIVYYSYNGAADNTCANFTKIAEPRWGSHFLGLYYNDEPGGKMLDKGSTLNNIETGETAYVMPDGIISKQYYNSSNDGYSNYAYVFYPSGEIRIDKSTGNFTAETHLSNSTTYFTNRTILFEKRVNYTEEPVLYYLPDGSVVDVNGTSVTGKGDITQFEPYQQVWDSRPLQTQADVAKRYVDCKHSILKYTMRNQSNVKLMTSDYALYWYDYLAGYDTVWAQLGWNNNPTQEIALVRGAAKMQGKEWGTMITWQSNDPPYLQTAEQMYNEMVQSYERGAEYVIVFNYTPNDNTLGLTGNSTRVEDGVGLLQDTHFEAMEKFWNDIVLNPQKTNNMEAEAAFVLPNSYGSGMRYSTDKIWGLWNTTSTSEQIWTQLQSLLERYGQKLDIIYDDPAFPVNGKYSSIHFWNQTG